MSAAGQRPILVTGGAGFIGSNLVDRLAGQGHRVIVYDALARQGVERNLAWLKARHGDAVIEVRGDVSDADALRSVAEGVEVIFHLAAQVAVTTSLADPMADFETNLRGGINVLEAARRQPRRPPVVFASTNKVYGDLSDVTLHDTGDAYAPEDATLRVRGVGEDRPLNFHTPYGVSKGAADQYTLDYARSFGLPTCVFRMSCIYGPRQMGTEDQGWVAHFLIRALAELPITIYGDGKQVRDLLHVSDAVDAYVAAWRNIAGVSGRAFNLGGGPGNAVSLRQVVHQIELMLGRRAETRFEDWRAGDQRYFVADASAARRALGLKAPLAWRDGLSNLAAWLQADRRPSDRHEAAA